MTQRFNGSTLRRLIDSCERCPGIEFFYGPFLSAAIAGREDEAMRVIMKAALDDNVPVETIDEIILQSHLFLGYPAMIEAARIFAAVAGLKNRSDRLPQAYTGDEGRAWNDDGLNKIRKIYGPAFDRLVAYINSFSPQILTWMINNGYGQVLSRPNASFPLRELSVVATLTVTSYENQLGAHVRGALNVGVDSELIAQTMDNCHFFCSRDNIRKARKILAEAAEA